MILIKSIEFIETKRDIEKIMYDTPTYNSCVMLEDAPVEMSFIMEMVRGRRFRRSDGTDIVVGMAEKPGKILGLMYENWEGIEDELKQTVIKLKESNEIINKHTSAPFWVRLKCLFTGWPKT